ncbi:hypothetical protein NMY22_g405 [Coprinellus aureogranulatus]|nr:hypothetical protein NMY22_g405 [Coprinellus aureogranulatus]
MPPRKRGKAAPQTSGGQAERRRVAVPEDDDDATPTTQTERSKNNGKSSQQAKVSALRNPASLLTVLTHIKGKNNVVVSGDEDSNSENERANDSGSDDAAGGDEDDDLKNLSDAQLRLLLKEESAYVAGDDRLGIWDVPEEDVEMVSRSQSRASSRMSIDEDADELGAHSGEEAIFPKKEANKGKGKRQQAFEDERPQIQSADSEVLEELPARSSILKMRRFPAHTKLVDGGARLQDQPDLIRLVVTTTIKRETTKILIDNAWPAIGLREEYCQRILTAAANEHVHDFPLVQDIINRLERDPSFGKILGNIALGRFSTTRTPVKTHAVNQIAAYELGTGPKCKERVEVLMQEDRYVCPGQWNQQLYIPEADVPYHHAAIVETLKAAFFQTSSSVGHRAVKEFNDSLVDAPRLIMPPAMVALAATGVFAALLEWESGRHKREQHFEGNRYASVYRAHIANIEAIKAESEIAYYSIFSRLYEQVTGSDGTAVQQQVPSARGLRGILDLSKYKAVRPIMALSMHTLAPRAHAGWAWTGPYCLFLWLDVVRTADRSLPLTTTLLLDVAIGDSIRSFGILPRHPAQYHPNATFPDPALEQHLIGTEAVRYSTVAALTFLLYDIFITFDDEVRLIWPNPLNGTKCLFFFIRYFPVMLQISIMFIGTPPFTFTHRGCYIWNVYQALASALVVTSVDYILILRVFALYPRNRFVRYLLLSAYLLEIITISVATGLAVPELKYDELCVITSNPVTFVVAAAAPIAFQTLLFGFTIWKFILAVKSGWGDIPIMRLLVRDGTWAFILLFLILVSEALLYGFSTEAFSGVLYGWLNTVFSFCGYRILLNLNDLNVSQSRGTSATTQPTSADIQFTSNFGFSLPPTTEEYELESRSPDRSRSTDSGDIFHAASSRVHGGVLDGRDTLPTSSLLRDSG